MRLLGSTESDETNPPIGFGGGGADELEDFEQD